MKKLFLTIALTTAAAFPAFAGMEHEHSSSHSMQTAKMEDMKHQMDTLEAKIGGFDVSLDIMTHKDYQKMMKVMKMEPMKPASGTTHHIALTIRKDGSKMEDSAVAIKVTGPDGKEESKTMSYNQDMMYQFTGHFNMPKKGKYQLAVSFKVGTETHQGLVYYEVK